MRKQNVKGVEHMKKYLLSLLLSVLFFGCMQQTSEQLSTTNISDSNSDDANANIKDNTLTLPSLSNGKYCSYDSEKEKLKCNFQASGVISKSEGITILANQDVSVKKCVYVQIVPEGETYLHGFFTYGSEMVEIGPEMNKIMAEKAMLNPCLLDVALKDGIVSGHFCLFNASVKSISCGIPITLTHNGETYNITNKQTKVDVCGLVALQNEYENYLVYINNKSDQIIELNEQTSRIGMANFISLGNEECG